MTETVTIEVKTEVQDAQQGMADLRDDLKKTQKESEKTKTSLGDISKDLSSISPQLGKVTQGIGRLTQSISKLGKETGSNGAFGRMTSGLGKLTSSSGFRKGVGIAGIGLAVGGILSSMMGNQSNKLAPFDKLNNIGETTMLDLLTDLFDKLMKTLTPMAGSLATIATATAGMYAIEKQANPEANPEPTPSTDPFKDIVDEAKKSGDKIVKDWKDGNSEIIDNSKKSNDEIISDIEKTVDEIVNNELVNKNEEQKRNRNWWERFRDDGSLSMASVSKGWLTLQTALMDSASSLRSSFSSLVDDMRSKVASAFSSITGGSSSSKGSSNTPSGSTTPTSETSSEKSLLKRAYDAVTSTLITLAENNQGSSTSPNASKEGSSKSVGESFLDTAGDAWGNFTDALGGAWNGFTETLDKGLQLVTDADNAIMDTYSGALGQQRLTKTTKEDTLNNLIDLGSAAVTGGLGKLVSTGISVGSKALSGLSNLFKGSSSGATDLLRRLGVAGFAEGGLFLPNQPQLAVLGDNKTEPEVAAPKGMIVDAVKEAMSSMTSGQLGMMSNRTEPVPITLEMDGKVLARLLYDPLNNETIRRNGVGFT